MLQLRRVRFASVGHPNARFAPLELALVGEDGRPTHAVVWLRNGGGKSSLLNLLFAVVRPHRREFLGGNDDGKDRRLADYVLDGDTGHVVIEWGRPGARTPSLVTGMVLEWRDRVRVADESRLRRLWYAFVPSDHREPAMLAVEPTLTFDTLPLAEDGRRLSLHRFRERLRARALGDATLRLVTPTSQAEWRRELEQHDLDPEVLRYQLQMNRDEGGASELFKRRCRTASAFVDMLLELAVADERTERVADVYSRYADELARRPDLERNRDFLAGTLERLEPLVDLSRAQQAAAHALQVILADAAALASGLRSAADDTRARAGADRARAADHRRAADAHDAGQRRLAGEARALDRRAAQLDVDSARQRHDEAATALAVAEAHLASTALLEPLARRLRLDAEIAALDGRFDADGSTATARLRHARDRLVIRLRAELARSAAAVDGHRRHAVRCQRDAERAAVEAHRATTECGRLEQAHATLRDRRAAWHRHLRTLRDRGLVRDDEDIGAALDRTRTALADAERARTEHIRHAETLDADIRAAYTRISRLDEALGDARARAGAHGHEQRQMLAAAATLVGDPRLRAVAETDEIDLWHAGMLADRLDAIVAEADRALADEAVTAAADRAAEVALQTDGLLPPRAAVADVVAVLASHGIDARPGWHYVAEHMPRAEREQLVAAAPALVDGVVVSGAADLAAARVVLEELSEPLRSVVVVGVAGHAGATVEVVAPVDPALYDRSHADRARTRLRARLDAADQRRAAMIAARDHDAALADRLRRLLRTYPDERRSQIDDDAEMARQDCDRLRAERDAIVATVERLEAERASVATTSQDEDLHRLRAATTDLAALGADRIDDAELERIARAETTARERADDAARRVDDLRRAAAQHLVSAQRDADAGDRLRDELAELATIVGPAAEDGDTTADPPTAAPDEPLETLRQRLRILQSGVDAERPADALGERRRLLIERRSELDHELAGVDDATVREASAMLRGPTGRDRRTRAAAARDAEQRRDRALEARAEAAERLRAARAALAREPADHHPADPVAADGVTSAAAARERAGELRAAAERERAAAADERARAATADQGASERRQRCDRLGHLAEVLTIELRARPGTAPDGTEPRPADVRDVADDPERAAARVDDLRVRIGECATDADRAARDLAAATAEIRRFVGDDRFAPLDGPIRSRFAADPVGIIRDDHAVRDELRIRLAQCEQKLEELVAHRRLLVREIAADTQRGLWLLRQADRVSSLPSGFDDWSGQRFLHIRFAAPAVDDDLIERLEAMVERLVDDGVRPAGLPLLQRAVHAAVGPTGFEVSILKPNPALRTQRVPVTELATFSGGEQLTAAILLYCTLARLRAQSQQTTTAAGVLTLDNPIGKSSNVTLLQLQRRVADAMGVQLIYTTAVDDREAVGVLPHWIRLRNERRDVHSGNLHVERAATPDDEHGEVAATHVWRRGDSAVPAPGDR